MINVVDLEPGTKLRLKGGITAEVVENPGDGAPCYAICMQKEEDQAIYMKAYVR